MNTTNRTLTFIAVAVIATLCAVGVKYVNRPVANADFADVGQEFFPEFKDPLKATSLSVVKYDSDTKEPLSFSVKQNDKGLWVIPSHHDYPAEAADRLAKTAASFIGTNKLALQSRNKDDWGRYGVADPDSDIAVDAEAKEGEEDKSRGTRVTLRDSGGNALVDLIIGKPVEGQNQRYYVRQPEKNNVYIAEIAADLSAKFSDWIEPDLLKLNQADIAKIVVDKYSIDEDKGEILRGESLEFDKDATANKWTVADLDAATESVKEAPINDLARNLDQLKIVGVRPKPEGLNADLTVSADLANNPVIMQILQADMQRQGFFIARGEDGRRKLVSNEGELVAGTKNGVRYTLYFGEIARGSAKDIETGLNEKKSTDGDATDTEAVEEKHDAATDSGDNPPKPDAKPADAETGPRRYLLVKVDFDESLLGKKPTEPVEPVKPEILNEEAASADASAETKDAPPAADPEPEAATPATETTPADEETSADDSEPQPETEEDAAADVEQDEQDEQDEPVADDPADVEPATTEPAESESTEATESTEQSPNEDAALKADEAQAADADPATSEETPVVTPAEPETQETAAAPAETPTESAPSATPATETTPPVDAKAEAKKEYMKALGQYESEKQGFADALKSWEERSKQGKKLSEELAVRFGAWYYVISADSFEKLRPSRADVVGPKEADKPADTSAPPSFDGLPGGIPGLGN
ncbi:MAG: DUF4340 domain-containing protein [Planctomycetaceae bacterium]